MGERLGDRISKRVRREVEGGIRPWSERKMVYQEESLLRKGENTRRLVIGIPCEHSLEESRICLDPIAVACLRDAGHVIWIERGAGLVLKYDDEAYASAGAKIVEEASAVFKADIVLKVEPPTLREIGYMKRGALLISALQMTRLERSYIEGINEKKISAIAFEFLKDAMQVRPIVRAMSEIAGSLVIFIAAEYMSNDRGGAGMLVGGVTGIAPTRIVILGAGTVAEYAARMALGLGADVQIFDDQLHRLRRIQQALGKPVCTSLIVPEVLSRTVRKADILIGALQVSDIPRPYAVSEEMVMGMKAESVIIDVSIDQYKCIETSEVTTHSEPIFRKHGVIHYGVPNITSRVARSASVVLSHIFLPILLDMGHSSDEKGYLLSHPHIMAGMYAYRGYLTNSHLGRHFNMDYKNLHMFIF